MTDTKSMTDSSILQVEDDANDVFLLQHAFMQAGISNPAHVATDGQMAVDYLIWPARGRLPIARNTLCPASCCPT
jgi:hypothetical protein